MPTNYISTSDLQVAVEDGLEVSRKDCPALAHEQYDHYPPKDLINEPLEVRQNRQQRRIYGIPVFWIIICLLILIIGGAVGGGVGAGVSRNKKSISTTTSDEAQLSSPLLITTATTTSDEAQPSSPLSMTTVTTTSPPATVTNTNDGCPKSVTNGSTYNSSTTTSYTIHCSESVTTGSIIRFNPPPTNTIFDCLDVCTRYNGNTTDVAKTGACVAATWVILDPDNPDLNRRCYLKSQKKLGPARGGTIVISGVEKL